MRILCQYEGYLPDVIGGQEVRAAHFLDYICRRGHEVLVLTSCVGSLPAGRYSYDGIRLRKFEFSAAMQSGRLQDIARLQREVNDTVHEFQPDLLHLNDVRPSSFFFLRRDVLRDIPRVLTLCSPLRPQAKGGLQSRLGQEADIVVAVSQSVADDAAEAISSIERKLIVIRDALPMPPLRPSPLPVAPVTFLCLGRVVEDKGMDIAIEALAMLHAEGLTANLVILGDGPQKKRLEQLVQERALQDHIRFLGWLMPGDIPTAINAATAVLVPSRWKEPFGLVALQGAQMGRPVIASRTGGLAEIVVHGETGLLVNPGDAAALAGAMGALVRVAGLATAMGSMARSRAEWVFDFNRFVTRYEEAFSSVSVRQPLGATNERHFAS
jgi:glycosyltransferase involved in cell wall biosynthesis